jgi:hypothetical protein
MKPSHVWLFAVATAVAAVRCDCEPTVSGISHVSEEDFKLVLPVAFCGAPLVDCGTCAHRMWDDSQVCEDTIAPLAEIWIQGAQDAGLAYDGGCAGRIVTAWLTQCPTEPENGWLGCDEECQFYHGDVPVGGACEIIGRRMSNCAQGLACGVDGVCHSPCELPSIATLGQACGVDQGIFVTPCDDGLACAEGTCVEGLGEGEPCGSEAPCVSGLWCASGDNQCQLRLPPGAACTSHESCEFSVCDGEICIEQQPLYCSEPTW